MLKTPKFGAKSLIAAASSLALVGGLAVATPAAANGGGYQERLENATFTWGVSTYATSSLAEQNTPENTKSNASFDVDTKAWTFTQGKGTRDRATGEVSIDYTGEFTVGKKNQGNYEVKFSNPTISTTGAAGALTADVQWIVTSGSAAAGTRSEPTRLKVLDLENVQINNANELTAVSPHDQVDADPAWNSGNPGNAGFAQEFTDFLAGPGLASHFRYTGSGGSNPGKTALPIAASFNVAPPKVEVFNASYIPVNGKRKVTVKGTGFDPSILGTLQNDKEVRGLYVGFGPNIKTVDSGTEDSLGLFYSAQCLTNYCKAVAPDANGEFTTTLDVTGIYTAKGKKYDGSKSQTPLGVSVWAASWNQYKPWEIFTPINFAKGATAYSKPGKVKKLKRKANKKRTKLKVSWAAPTATKVEFRDNKAVRYQVRVTNYKGKKYSKWKNRTSRSLTFNTKRKGTYKFQVRAVSKAGAGKAVGLKYKKK